MIDPTIKEILANAGKAAGPLLGELLSLLTEDGESVVLEALDRDRDALDAVPSTRDAIAEMRARHLARVQAHEQARGQHIRDAYRVAETTQGFLERASRSETYNPTERQELRAAASLVKAALDGEIVSALPRVLDVPRGAWSEPGHGED